ncbi:nose resistant to fluoxetine protein 6-like [Zophobas morio]|uniref:nose resistant to fluoxetine protein 6-like n=1 Tax=Zophobas morio TaxID=2755281 RepID=UPI003082ADF0
MQFLPLILTFPVVVFSQSFSPKIPLQIFNSLARKAIKNSHLHENCAADLKLLITNESDQKLWIAKMFDASGKISPGLFKGNFHFMGDYDECLEIDENVGNRTVAGQYCTLFVTVFDEVLGSFRSSVKENEIFKTNANIDFEGVLNVMKDPTLMWGVCIPKSCSSENVAKLSSYLENYFNIKVRITVVEDMCQYKDKSVKRTPVDYFAFIFFAVILFLIVVSTSYDFYLQMRGDELNIFVAFSIYTNIKKLVASSSNTPLDCLNGIKVLSCCWIVLGHVFVLQLFSVKNLLYVFTEWRHETLSIFLWSPMYTVNTFFAVSGFLRSYIYLKRTETFRVGLGAFYLIRYVRMTPALLAIILIHTSLVKFASTGPYGFFTNNYLAIHCRKTWWSAFFFFTKIMNFKMCGMHLWYLAVDNQLYLCAPLILFFIRKYPRRVIGAMAAAFVASTIYSITVTIYKRIGFTPFEWNEDYASFIYFSTIHHAPSWLIGIFFGYLFHFRKFRLSKNLHFALLVLSLYVMINLILKQTVFFGEYDVYRAALWNGLAKPLWALAVSFIIFSCVSGNGGFVATFLSLPVFRIFGRLTYCIYLVHFSVISSYLFNQKEVVYFSTSITLFRALGLSVLVVLGSVVLHLGFEAPIIALLHYKNKYNEKRQ